LPHPLLSRPAPWPCFFFSHASSLAGLPSVIWICARLCDRRSDMAKVAEPRAPPSKTAIRAPPFGLNRLGR
jgi:hypothetical protein